MTIEQVAAKFEDARKHGRGYLCVCPCHQDSLRSLDIAEVSGPDGRRRIAIYCHAGCATEAILKAVGLGWDELIEDTDSDGEEREQAPAGLMLQTVQETGKGVREIGIVIQRAVEAMASMAETVRVTNERMSAIEEEMRGLREALRTMEKVTPEEAKTVNRLIRQRAKDVCEEYRMGLMVDLKPGKGRPGGFEWAPDPEKLTKLTAVIRADVRAMTGVRTAREIPRCDWGTVVDYIQGWDDFEKIQRIRKGGQARKDAGADGRPEARPGGAV